MLDERVGSFLKRPSCSVAQAAEVLGMSRQGIINAVERGDIRATRIGKRIVIPTAPLRQMLLVEESAPASAT